MSPRRFHNSDHPRADLPDAGPRPPGYVPEWSLFSNVNHRLALLDSPDPNGWTVAELAAEYGCPVSTMRSVVKRLVAERYALVTDEGRYIGA